MLKYGRISNSFRLSSSHPVLKRYFDWHLAPNPHAHCETNLRLYFNNWKLILNSLLNFLYMVTCFNFEKLYAASRYNEWRFLSDSKTIITVKLFPRLWTYVTLRNGRRSVVWLLVFYLCPDRGRAEVCILSGHLCDVKLECCLLVSTLWSYISRS